MATNGSNGFHLPTTQKAAQFNPKDKTVSINEVPIPTIGPDEILVKIKSASLCHSDLMLFEPNEQNLTLGEGEPFTMGHEACGTIISLGSSVPNTFSQGDKIGWLPIVSVCYDCDGCQIHNLHCENSTPQVQGMSCDGYFQEYAAIHYRNAARIPEGMELESLAPMFCAGCTAFNSVVDTVEELGEADGKWVSVVGCGGLGHLGVQYAKAMGCKVIGIDLSDEALQEAKAQGADHVFNPQTNPDYIAQIKTLTDGKGCHAAINYTNSVPAYTSTSALLRTNGVLMVTGIPQKPLQFSAMEISMNRIRVRGSNNGTTPRLVKCLEFSQKHGIKPHLTRFKLEQFQEMVDLMQSGKHKGRMGVVFD